MTKGKSIKYTQINVHVLGEKETAKLHNVDSITKEFAKMKMSYIFFCIVGEPSEGDSLFNKSFLSNIMINLQRFI